LRWLAVIINVGFRFLDAPLLYAMGAFKGKVNKPLKNDSLVTDDSPWKVGLPIIALAGIVLLVHGHAIFFDFVNWDDDYFLLNNPLVAAPASQPWDQRFLTPQMGYAVPVLMAIQSMQLAIFGPEPSLFHLTNLIVHWLNMSFAFLIARRLGFRHAFLGALIFGLHPITVEPVVWVSGLKDLLAAFFVFLASYVYLGPRGADPRQSVRRTLGATGLFLLAGFTKPTTILAILIVPFIDIVCRKFQYGKHLLRWGLPIFLIWSVLLTCNFPLQEEYRENGLAPKVWETVTVDSVTTPERSFSHIAEDVVFAFRTYAGNYLAPKDLRAIYIRHYEAGQVSMVTPSALVSIFAILGLIVLCVFGVIKRKAVAFGLLFAAIFYLPASMLLFPLHGLGDPFLYLPCFGLSLFILALFEKARPQTLKLLSPVLGRMIARAFCVVLAVISFMQGTTWSSSVTLWEHVGLYHPQSPQVKDKMAEAYVIEHQFTDGAEILESMRNDGTLLEGGLTRLAYCYLMTRRYVEAEETMLLQVQRNDSVSMARKNHAAMLVHAWPKFRTRFPEQARESLALHRADLENNPQEYPADKVKSLLESLGPDDDDSSGANTRVQPGGMQNLVESESGGLDED
jgi:protein O-mannosyl-transferase